MANEIYNTSWWGTALDTARTAGTNPDFFGSQMKLLTSEQDTLVTNGTFDTDSDWGKGSNTIISNGEASFNGVSSYVYQDILTIGKIYTCSVSVKDWVSGAALSVGSSATGSGTIYSDITRQSNTTTTFTFTAVSTTLGIGSRSFDIEGSIDNVSVQLVRCELEDIEAKKCLADWIHTTALKDLNN